MDHEEYDEIGKVVFHTLNPILRNLLNSIEQFRALDTRQRSTTRYHEMAISLYKTQNELYQSIQKEIYRWKSEIDSTYLYRKALNEMQTFFFLPIVLTMQQTHTCTSSIHDDDFDVEANDRLDVVLNNAHINTLEEAAKSWRSYIQFVYDQNIELSNAQYATILLDPNLGIKILTAATIAMSDISKTTHDSSEKTLNIGDNCHQAILAAIESLMKSQQSCTMFTEKFMNVLLQNRSFAEMLVIGCMHSLNDKIINDHSSYLVDIKGNVEFKLQSIRTLESILLLQEDDDSDRNMIWRMFFPDIFMKLYQTAFVHVRFTTSASSPKLASESMKVISTLMKRALVVPTSMVGTPLDHFQALISGPLENETITKMTPEMKTFFERVHTIIAKPLILLINVASSNSSKLVRSVLVHNVCDTILNQTVHCWNLKIDATSNEAMQPHQVPIAALECIILGLVDENDHLSLDCTKIFNSFIASLTSVHISSWSRDIFLPRVISQIEALPSLARSGRNSDLIATVRLISGYLKSFLIIGNMKKGTGGKINANLHSFLVTQLTTKEIRQCIVDCLVMDNFNTIKYGLIRNCESSQSFNLRYLNEEASKEFKVMVHSLSSLIGLKRAVLYVDGCISDLFDGLSSRISHQRFVYDIEHSRWMERYFGYGVLAYFILSTMRRSSMNFKRLKYIESLSKAILPIIVSDELWKLPTTHECAKLLGATINTSSSHANIFNSSDAIINLTSNKGVSLKATQYNPILTSSAATTDALVANSMLQTCLLDTILSISSILQDQFRQFIPSLLYPLLSKISDLNSPSVRSASSATIAAIAKSSNYTSPEVMLSCNFAYLMEIMTIELKNPTHNGTDLFSQSYCFYSLHSVVKNMIDYEGEDHIEPHLLETRILLIVTLLSTMGVWFNRNFKKSTEGLLRSIVVPLSLVRVYHSTFKQLNVLIGDDISEGKSSHSEVGFKWENLLGEFQVIQNLESETVRGADESRETKSTQISLNTLKSLINCADEVLQINALLVSLPDLKLQCESLDLMKQIYKLLATIQNVAQENQSSTEDQLVDIGNPLLQHAHRYWLPLQSNLKSAVDSYLHRDAHYETESARGHLAALISSLISVISTLSDYCAGFLAEKVQKDIFPLFFQMLDTIFKGSNDFALTENDQDVLVSVAICLTKMFSKYEMGVALQATIPPLSAMILPFLSFGDIVGQKVFETMQAILAVNSDFTLRSLYHLSCTRFPERPLLDQLTIGEDNTPQDESNAILRKRSLDLIRFIESGPEHPLY